MLAAACPGSVCRNARGTPSSRTAYSSPRGPAARTACRTRATRKQVLRRDRLSGGGGDASRRLGFPPGAVIHRHRRAACRSGHKGGLGGRGDARSRPVALLCACIAPARAVQTELDQPVQRDLRRRDRGLLRGQALEQGEDHGALVALGPLGSKILWARSLACLGGAGVGFKPLARFARSGFGALMDFTCLRLLTAAPSRPARAAAPVMPRRRPCRGA
jgi:hypothetical protein